MNIHSILFPTDFSEFNRGALQYASTLAAEAGATLHIVHVLDPCDTSDAMRDMSYLSAAVWQQQIRSGAGMRASRILVQSSRPSMRSRTSVIAQLVEPMTKSSLWPLIKVLT